MMQLNSNIKKTKAEKKYKSGNDVFFNIHQQAILLHHANTRLNNVVQSDLPKFCVAWIQQDNGNIA